MKDRATLVKQARESGISEEDFKMEFRNYAKSLAPTQSELEEEFKQMTLGSSEVFKDAQVENYQEKIAKLKNNLSMMTGDEVTDITGNTYQEIFDGYCDKRINGISLSAAEVSIYGIQQAWSDPVINIDQPNLLVTKQDLSNPNDCTSSSSLINTTEINGADPVTQDELERKLKYASIKNPDSTSLIIVGVGTEHTALLAVNPNTRQYRYIDSKNEDINLSLSDKLQKALPDYTDITVRTPGKQQYDTSTSGYWVLKNAQTIAQDGIEAPMYYNPNKQIMQEEINRFGVEVQGSFVDSIIAHQADKKHRVALEVSPIDLGVRSGYLVQEVVRVEVPSPKPISKSLTRGKVR